MSVNEEPSLDRLKQFVEQLERGVALSVPPELDLLLDEALRVSVETSKLSPEAWASQIVEGS